MRQPLLRWLTNSDRFLMCRHPGKDTGLSVRSINLEIESKKPTNNAQFNLCLLPLSDFYFFRLTRRSSRRQTIRAKFSKKHLRFPSTYRAARPPASTSSEPITGTCRAAHRARLYTTSSIFTVNKVFSTFSSATGLTSTGLPLSWRVFIFVYFLPASN